MEEGVQEEGAARGDRLGVTWKAGEAAHELQAMIGAKPADHPAKARPLPCARRDKTTPLGLSFARACHADDKVGSHSRPKNSAALAPRALVMDGLPGASMGWSRMICVGRIGMAPRPGPWPGTGRHHQQRHHRVASSTQRERVAVIISGALPA